MEKIFCILGKSSSGKDTLVSMTSEELKMPIATSFTTRPKREGEVEGREYNFITDEEFKDLYKKDMLAEFTSYNIADVGVSYYGLTKEELEKGKHTLVIVNPDGLQQLINIYGDKVVTILVECDGIERLERSIKRDKKANPRELCRRFLVDEDDFKDVVCDYVIDTTSREELGLYDFALMMIGYILGEISEEESIW